MLSHTVYKRLIGAIRRESIYGEKTLGAIRIAAGYCAHAFAPVLLLICLSRKA